MTKPVTIPNTFATATTAIPLSNLDADFSTVATALNDANTYSNYAADSGTANAYVVTLTGVSTTYTAGLRIQFKAGNANTGASTLNVNAGGTKNITFQDASALSSGTIAANAIVDVMYDGTQFLLMNDPAGTVGTGDVVGPVGATANAAAIFDSTTGRLIKDSKVIITPVANSSTLTIANNKTVTVNNTLTLSGTDSTTMTFPSTNATIARTDSAQTFTGVQTFSSNPILSGGTANGVLYLNGSSVATSGSALTFDGTTFQYTGAANFATSSGNVGIGTTSPGNPLTVNANPGAAGVPVAWLHNSGNVADYDGVVISSVNDGSDAEVLHVRANNTTYNNGTSLMLVRGDGSVGIGVTPSAWSVYKTLQIGRGALVNASTETDLVHNAFWNGSNWIYVATDFASRHLQVNGQHRFFTAPSGTANTIITSFTQAMTLDASGNLLVRATTPYIAAFSGITVQGATSGTGNNLSLGLSKSGTPQILNGDVLGNIYFYGVDNDVTAGNNNIGAQIAAVATTDWTTDGTTSNAALVFYTHGTTSGAPPERARITSGGDFRVKGAGTAGSTDAFQVSGSAPADAARITSGGELLVNTTTANGQLNVAVPNGTTNVIYLQRTGVTTANARVTFANAYTNLFTSDRFQIEAGGSGGVYLAAAGTSWTAVSDERKKDIIEPITNAAQKVSSLRAVIGKYKTDTEGTRRSFLIAQDVQAVLPEAVDTTNSDELGLSYSDVIPLLAAAIKEQQAMINELKAEVAALKAK